jgi:hypothetical protein
MPDSERLSRIAEILGRAGLLIWIVSRCEPNVRRGLEGDLQAKLHGAHLRSIDDVGDASAISAVDAGRKARRIGARRTRRSVTNNCSVRVHFSGNRVNQDLTIRGGIGL